MPFHESNIPLLRILLLFAGLFILGTLATLPLFKYRWRELVRSRLFVKILLWVPIFAVFIGFLHLGGGLRLLVLVGLAGMAFRELLKNIRGRHDKPFFLNYYFLFVVALLHFYLITTAFSQEADAILVTVCFASVLSDVFAFFCGKYWGRHALPEVLNKNKSWEGVAGQIAGAAVGVAVVHIVVLDVYAWWLFVPVGIGTAAGDLLNSYTKRRLKIAEWSNGIPGHGGYLDRLASLAGSALLTYYFLALSF